MNRKDIAVCGDFSLRYKTYIGSHDYTTHDIEIVKWKDNYCFTIADWSSEIGSDLVSCGSRLLDAIETIDDLKAIKILAKVGKAILETDCVLLENDEEVDK